MNYHNNLRKNSYLKIIRNNFSIIIMYLCLTVAVLAVLLPLFVVLFAAFKTRQQIGVDFPLKPPLSLNFNNFKTAFFDGKVLNGLKISSILVLVSVIINVIIGTTTAYALGRFEFKFKKWIFGLLMLGMLVPSNLTEISRFHIISSLHVYNSIYAPLIIYAVTDVLQLYVYLQFLEKIPSSLDESAMIDGCSYFGIFYKIIFPLLIPAIATLAIIKTVWVVNDMFIPYLYMPSMKLRTLTTTLMDFSSGRFASWETLSAAIILVALPTILLFLFFQRYIFEGIVAGAVKE